MVNASSLTNEILQALVAADDDRKHAALRALRGERLSPPPPALEPLLTLADLARAMKFHPATLWRWRVPGHRLGGRRRYRVTEVEAYLSSPAFSVRAAEIRQERRGHAGVQP